MKPRRDLPCIDFFFSELIELMRDLLSCSYSQRVCLLSISNCWLYDSVSNALSQFLKIRVGRPGIDSHSELARWWEVKFSRYHRVKNGFAALMLSSLSAEALPNERKLAPYVLSSLLRKGFLRVLLQSQIFLILSNSSL